MTSLNNAIRFVARTDRGRIRDTNEDAVCAGLAPDDKAASHGHLFAVADGMGGHAAGEVASALAAATIRDVYYAAPLTASDDPAAVLAAAFRAANHAILGDARRNPERFQMGTTCTAAIVRGMVCWAAHIGDSRLYLYRDGALRPLTRDHNLAEELFQQGLIGADDLPNHHGQHVLTRALGIDEGVEPELLTAEPLHPGDRLLLCSDGLLRVLAEREIADTLAGPEIVPAAQFLIDEANLRGAPDNVTVVVIELAGNCAGCNARPAGKSRGSA
jgi:serine/threonine protein phosphatase PrpC